MSGRPKSDQKKRPRKDQKCYFPHSPKYPLWLGLMHLKRVLNGINVNNLMLVVNSFQSILSSSDAADVDHVDDNHNPDNQPW